MVASAGRGKHWVTQIEPHPTKAGMPQLLISVELVQPTISVLSILAHTPSFTHQAPHPDSRALGLVAPVELRAALWGSKGLRPLPKWELS